jgi:coproporphyrinogen III oxidase-like Fe-S oxidoreductase
VEDVKADLDAVRLCVDFFEKLPELPEPEKETGYRSLMSRLGEGGQYAFQSAASWYRAGMESVFLQDANAMLVKADHLVAILTYLRALFPAVRRVTAYGRSHTVARITDENLRRIADAGLNRIHIGMESGSDTVLRLVDKGADKAAHIAAGQKGQGGGHRAVGILYPRPGGPGVLPENALETADAMNQINPDFIRIRTLSVPRRALLYKDYEDGVFTRTNDTDVVRELRLFVAELSGSRASSEAITY